MTLNIKRFNELTTDELYSILQLRVSVFVVEQNCPYMELDGLDQGALHLWLEDEDGIEAYLRILERGAENENVAIGRVLSVKRHRGLGTRILTEGINAAREIYGAEPIYVEAQAYAKDMYEKLGFRQTSDVFPIDGIEHVKMILE